jgi:hypothetical protein
MGKRNSARCSTEWIDKGMDKEIFVFILDGIVYYKQVPN